MKIGQTTKQKLYLEEVLRLHREKGYGEDRISRIIPIGHTTVSRWITKFATANQQNLVQMRKKESRVKEVVTSEEKDLKALKGENARLQASECPLQSGSVFQITVFAPILHCVICSREALYSYTPLF
ncbi:MAG: hypothetical protein RR854_02925 [Muribaculaceae bacterium]